MFSSVVDNFYGIICIFLYNKELILYYRIIVVDLGIGLSRIVIISRI